MSISGERTGAGGGVTGGRPCDSEPTSCCPRFDCAGPSDIVLKGVVLQTLCPESRRNHGWLVLRPVWALGRRRGRVRRTWGRVRRRGRAPWDQRDPLRS